MMRRSISLFCAVLCVSGPAFGWNADEIDFPGEGNGWTAPASLNATAKFTGPDGSPEWFRYTLTSLSNNADYDFKMVAGNDWNQDYGGNLAFAKNNTGTLFYQPGGDTPAKLAGGVSNGFRYVFTAKNPGLANTDISIMELSGDPVLIDAVTASAYGTVETGQVITMTITLATNPPPEEKVYVRLTTNNFATSTILAAPVTGKTATAIWTNFAASTVTTKWYALCSTATKATLETQSSFGIDALTLSWANNGGTNYQFQTNPRDAAFVYHNDNRVIVSGSNVQVWVKIGYANGDGSSRWVQNGAIYYTLDGANPTGGHGSAASGATRVVPLAFDHMEWDQNPAGDAMWWVGTITNVPGYSNVQYRIGAWYDGASPERFADYIAGTNARVFSFQLGVLGEPVLLVNGQTANYTTTKLFLDEAAGETQQISVVYMPGVASPQKVEIFSNLGRRDYADADSNADGIPDGIKPPAGATITTNSTGTYFMAWPMTETAPGVFTWTGNVARCGAYRLTARHSTNGADFIYYSSSGRRDHAVVVSPRRVRDLTMYELNTLTVEAQSADQAGRSTFADLLGAADGDADGYDPFNLDYLNFLNVNCLWFQPIHPTGGARVENDPVSGAPYSPGSPYATKNYWEVGAAFGSANTEASAMAEFTNFVAKCDANTNGAGSIHIMLDGVFNHTAWDAVMGQGAVDLGLRNAIGDTNTSVVGAGDPIGQRRAYWYSDGGSGTPNYCDEADWWVDAYNNDFAVAPDRGDFGKWNDVAELYFGRYAALVCLNPQDNGSYLNEGDWFDGTSLTPGVVELWRYFAYYPEYWLKKTGHAGTNSWTAADNRGIDGLRCDFGQGLPPQAWEYIINRTRSKKWNFVFMAETLDGGVPGYRSNRHFDVLNESLVFQFTQAKVNDSWAVRSAIEQRRTAYNGGTILLNLTSHDETLPDDDPWLVASRYGALSAVDGIPMLFYGQDKGIKNYQSNPATGYDDGFVHHELNFGKYVPNFKRWNQLTTWFSPPPDSTGIDAWYGRVNGARHASAALRGPNRYFLSRTGGGDNAKILAVAKYETAGLTPAQQDVVFCFANLLRHGEAHAAAADTYNLQPVWGLLGLNTGKSYRVRNLAASNPDAKLAGWPRTGSDLYQNGLFVSLGGGTVNAITNDGELVQYLKLEEVNQSPVLTVAGPHTVPVGSSTNFTIGATDPDGDTVTVTNTVAPAGASFAALTFSWTAGPAFAGTTNPVVFVANDGRGDSASVVTGATSIVVPGDYDGDGLADAWEWNNFATLTNAAGGDADADGFNNLGEFVAGTQPTNATSLFRVTQHVTSGVTNRLITIATQPGRLYTIQFADASPTNNASWQPFANAAQGIGTWTETNLAPSTFSFRDDEGPATTLAPPATGQRTYRIHVTAP